MGAARLALLLPILITAFIAPARAEPDRRFAYVYVEANEGSSSGGHVALRFGDEVYHFQHDAPGVLRLHTDEAADFLFRYALLDNRGVHETDIAAGAETVELLRDEFSRRALIQTAQFDAREALRSDAELIEHLFSSAAPLPLPGFGYLSSGADALLGAEVSPSLASLRACMRRSYGASFTGARRAVIVRELAALRPPASGYGEVSLRPDQHPGFPVFYSTRYRDLLAAGEALRIVETAPRLRPGTYRALDGDEFALLAAEKLKLGAFAAKLGAELCGLPSSPRPDWGSALAVGMARLAAVELSLESARWVVLDLHGADTAEAQLPEGALRAESLDVLEAESGADLAAARADLLASNRLGEAGYSAIETAADRLLEARAARAGKPLRMPTRGVLPALPATAHAVRPDWSDAEAETYAAAARAAASRLENELVHLYRYDLIRRNCVSEVFATVDAALTQSAGARADSAAIRAESEARLGGYVETAGTLSFIPIVSQQAVAGLYRFAGQRDHASYRERRLARMLEDESAWRVRLRESNTLTSVAYRPGADDSSFLFFTEDEVLLRPLLGVVNFAYGLGDGIVGVATMPFEGPRRLVRGFRGALFSLPELAFINLRKGTTSFVERRWAADLG